VSGRTLGHFEVLEKLGEGGMGVVYKAHDSLLRRSVALKVLPASRVGDVDRRARFVQEARSASALNHPNIVTVYEVNADTDEIFIAMELVDGKPLDRVIPRDGMRVKAALDVAIQIAAGMAAAHAAGVVHRDLKPANIMLTADGRVKLLDFGIAKVAEVARAAAVTATIAALTLEGLSSVRPRICPPSTPKGALDSRSDIFSFGSVLYEMLTGRRPFHGNSTASIIAAVLEKDPGPLPATLPGQVKRIVNRCLDKDPDHRYQHAADLKIALEDALADAVSPAAEITPGGPGRSRYWRYGAVALVAAAAAFAAARLLRVEASGRAELTLARITGDAGITKDAAISRDGGLIAYASDRAGNGDLDIWVQHRGSSDAIRITQSPSDEFDPSFSADGSQLVYASLDGIYILPALGGEPRRLTTGGVRPRLSPDGTQVLYQNRPPARDYGASFLFDIPTGKTRSLPEQLKAPLSPVWSPNGTHVLVEAMDVHSSGDFELSWYVMPADTLKPVRVGLSPGSPQQWLDDGRVIFNSNAGSMNLVSSRFPRPRRGSRDRCDV
jgi:predicted Ser/Thr protein kinase